MRTLLAHLTAVLLATSLAGGSAALAQQAPAQLSFSDLSQPSAEATPHPAYVRAVARDAYIWGWPLVNMLNRRARITQAHGTTRLADPATGATDATVFAMYHPAYALRNPAVERESYEDMALIPSVLLAARERRAANRAAARAAMAGSTTPTASPDPAPPVASPADPATDADQLSLF